MILLIYPVKVFLGGGSGWRYTTTVVIRQVQSDMDFGPVVKPLGITVKKEVGKVVETSAVVRSQAINSFEKRGNSP